jgi:hypothetical protein
LITPEAAAGIARLDAGHAGDGQRSEGEALACAISSIGRATSAK